MSDTFDDMTPDEVAAMTERLEYTGEEATIEELGIDLDPETTLVPRSVKLPAPLDRACKARAKAAGLTSPRTFAS
ncbi:hypothetical protein AB0N05_30530 [Nocardia sp. NPDC051030]|uniref:hypothetical protein n=1 Tax=Nocardia sp. NPDC051030 TaxID=3155162 RepID=UPI003426324B